MTDKQQNHDSFIVRAGQEFGGPLNLAALCGRIGRIVVKAGSAYIADFSPDTTPPPAESA